MLDSVAASWTHRPPGTRAEFPVNRAKTLRWALDLQALDESIAADVFVLAYPNNFLWSTDVYS